MHPDWIWEFTHRQINDFDDFKPKSVIFFRRKINKIVVTIELLCFPLYQCILIQPPNVNEIILPFLNDFTYDSGHKGLLNQ